MITIAQIEAQFPANETVEVHGRKLRVDGVIETGPNTKRHGTVAMVGFVGPRGAIYVANVYTDGTISDLITLPRM